MKQILLRFADDILMHQFNGRLARHRLTNSIEVNGRNVKFTRKSGNTLGVFGMFDVLLKLPEMNHH